MPLPVLRVGKLLLCNKSVSKLSLIYPFTIFRMKYLIMVKLYYIKIGHLLFEFGDRNLNFVLLSEIIL
jgi:hypothetical protein